MAHGHLAQALIPLSVAGDWSHARLEWDLQDVYYQDEPQRCLCGHFPIKEVCVLRNRLNGQVAEVGNVCVNKFLGLPSDRLFASLRRVLRDIERALSEEVILFAHAHGWINDWERDFYLDTAHKRQLTEKQLAKRVQVNRRVTLRAKRHAATPNSPLPS